MKIAVVIPALEESAQITGAIATARPAPHSSQDRDSQVADGLEIEVVVVDGGSLDQTRTLARRSGALVLTCPGGRARQLDAGWRAVTAEVILFLHADTRLPQNWETWVSRSMRDPSVAGGAFRLRFCEPGWALRMLEFFVRVRVAAFGLPYGDQAIFVRRSVLHSIGGVPAVPIMEDLDLVREIKRQGRLMALPAAATTSARRYLTHGILRTVLRHGVALLAWRVGLDRARVAVWCRL